MMGDTNDLETAARHVVEGHQIVDRQCRLVERVIVRVSTPQTAKARPIYSQRHLQYSRTICASFAQRAAVQRSQLG
jgi:hypothetical protein